MKEVLPVSTIVDESINFANEFYGDDNALVLLNWALYVNNVINKDALLSRFKIIRNNKAHTVKNIYHDKILNRWDEKTYLASAWKRQAAEKCYEYLITVEDIFLAFKKYLVPMKANKEIFEYINIWVKDDIIRYFTDSWHDARYFYETRLRYAKQIGLSIVNENNLDGYDYGYCCSDCDGDLDSYLDGYVSREINHHIEKNWKTELEKRFSFRYNKRKEKKCLNK